MTIIYIIIKHFLVQDSEGVGDHNSGTEQLTVSDSESEASAKFEDRNEEPEQEEPPETEYIVKDEGDLGCSVSNFCFTSTIS